MELFLPELDLSWGVYSQCEDGHDRVIMIIGDASGLVFHW